MTAPTTAVEYLLARAAVRATGLLHIVSRRDSGALNPVCGANPIRSAEIEERHALDDAGLLCPACGAHAASLAGSVEEGVAVYLGRGTAGEARPVLLELPTAAIRVGAGYARRTAGEGIDGLVESVRERGIVQPILVRRTEAGYELVDGGRRLYAARVAGQATVPAIARDLDAADAAVDGLLANLHRVDLNPIEQAAGYARALEVLGISKAALADRLGVSRPHVSNTIRLLGLPEQLQARLLDGGLTAQQGRELLAIDDPDEQAARAAQLAEGRAARTARPSDPRLDQVAQLLAGLLEERVLVTAGARGTRIVIEVPDADRVPQLLERLGAQTAAA